MLHECGPLAIEGEAGFTALAQGFGKLAKSVVGGREVRKEAGRSARESI